MKLLISFGILCLFLVEMANSLNKDRDCKCRIQSKKRIVGGRKSISSVCLLNSV